MASDALYFIADYTVPSATNTFTFNSIPQTYTDLVMFESSQTYKGGGGWYDIQIQPNASTTGQDTRVQYAYSTGQKSALADTVWTTRTATALTSPSATVFGGGWHTILGYTGSRPRWVFDTHAPYVATTNTNTLSSWGGSYYSGGAITSLKIQCIGGYNIFANTRFTLYGLKNS